MSDCKCIRNWWGLTLSPRCPVQRHAAMAADHHAINLTSLLKGALAARKAES